MSVVLEKLHLDPDDGGPPLGLMPYGDPWIADVAEFDVGWPTVRTNVRERAQASGTIDNTRFHGGRIVTLELGILHGPSARRLIGSCSPSRRPVITFRRSTDDFDLRMKLAGDHADAPHTRTGFALLETTLQWRCPDGILEGPVESHTMSVAAPETGVSFPTTVPFTLPAAAARGVVSVNNRGETDAWPTLRINGPVTDPSVTNDATGESIALNYEITAGSFVTVSMRDRTVLLNGDSDASLFDKVDLPTSRFWQLQPGSQQVRLSATTSAAPSNAKIMWRPALLW